MNIISQNNDAIQKIQDGVILAINKYIQNASYDKTIRSRITGILSNNKYQVLINGVTYTVKSTSIHKVNDIVNIIIPQNNYNEMFIIPEGITADSTLPANGGNADTVNFHTVESNVPKNAYFITETDQSRLTGYVYDQIQSSTLWKINHPLNKFPSVTIVDTNGNAVIGDISYISKNQIYISFSVEFSGKAYLS